MEERTIPRINETLGDEIDSVCKKIDRVENALNNSCEGENNKTAPQTSFIIRNLSKREREDITYEVNRLLKDGLKLRDKEVQSAERKENRTFNRKAGLVVAKCKSREDKQAIMKIKSKLKDSRRYENVYIEHDLSRQQRVFNSNMRTIVNAIGRDKLQVKGSRVNFKNTNSEDRNECQQRNAYEKSDREDYRYWKSDGAVRNHDRDDRIRDRNERRNYTEGHTSDGY